MEERGMENQSDETSAEPPAVQPLPVLAYRAANIEPRGPTGWDIFNGVVAACFSLGFVGMALACFYCSFATGGSLCCVSPGILFLVIANMIGRGALHHLRGGIKGIRY